MTSQLKNSTTDLCKEAVSDNASSLTTPSNSTQNVGNGSNNNWIVNIPIRTYQRKKSIKYCKVEMPKVDILEVYIPEADLPEADDRPQADIPAADSMSRADSKCIKCGLKCEMNDNFSFCRIDYVRPDEVPKTPLYSGDTTLCSCKKIGCKGCFPMCQKCGSQKCTPDNCLHRSGSMYRIEYV